MEGDRTWQEQMDTFMQSELAETVIRPGMATAFAVDFDDWLRSLSLDRGEGDSPFAEYLESRLGQFLEHELDTGHLNQPNLNEMGIDPGLWDTLYGVAVIAVEARYEAEVIRGVREDRRAPIEGAQDAPEGSALDVLTTRVQAFVQAVKDFVRGRELEDSTQEHGAER